MPLYDSMSEPLLPDYHVLPENRINYRNICIRLWITLPLTLLLASVLIFGGVVLLHEQTINIQDVVCDPPNDKISSNGLQYIPKFHIFTQTYERINKHWEADNTDPEHAILPTESVICTDGVKLFGMLHSRGHVSNLFPKHSFLFHRSVENVAPEEFGWIGEHNTQFTRTKKWILYGPYIDTTFIRNPLSFWLYRSLGGWASDTQFIKVVLNNVEMGLYVLTMKIDQITSGIKQHDKAITHQRQKSVQTLLKFDWPDHKHTSFSSPASKSNVVIVYPSTRYIDKNPELYTRIHSGFDYIDDVISKPGHPLLKDVIDMDSFIRFYMLEELAKDADGYGLSAFVRLDINEHHEVKLYHWAPWDFHLGYGFTCMPIYYQNIFTNISDVGVRGWNVENVRDSALWVDKMNHPNGMVRNFGRNIRKFFLNLWTQPLFRTRFHDSWLIGRGYSNYTGSDAFMTFLNENRPLATQFIIKKIDEYQSLLQDDAMTDINIWTDSNRCAFFSCCHPEDTRDYRSAIDHLKMYITQRLFWIDKKVADEIMGTHTIEPGFRRNGVRNVLNDKDNPFIKAD